MSAITPGDWLVSESEHDGFRIGTGRHLGRGEYSNGDIEVADCIRNEADAALMAESASLRKALSRLIQSQRQPLAFRLNIAKEGRAAMRRARAKDGAR